jgi:hypothetical protein
VASSASSAGVVSPMGEPVPRLPPIVAPLRISREANWGKTWSSSGSRPSRRSSTSDRLSAAPISTADSVVSKPRSSGSWSIATTNGARCPRRLTSTPVSVHPATSSTSGRSASRVSASASPDGRTNSAPPAATRVAGTSGGGWLRRAASRSSSSGAPRAKAASRMGR